MGSLDTYLLNSNSNDRRGISVKLQGV